MVKFNFKESYFTKEELEVLRIMFESADTAAEAEDSGDSKIYWRNVLHNLKEKLGIGDIV